MLTNVTVESQIWAPRSIICGNKFNWVNLKKCSIPQKHVSLWESPGNGKKHQLETVELEDLKFSFEELVTLIIMKVHISLFDKNTGNKIKCTHGKSAYSVYYIL